MRAFALAALLALAPAARAACTTPSTNAQLVAEMDEATDLFGKLEVDAFKASAVEASKMLECLSEPISRANAAAYHRLRGLALFLDRDSPAARRSFAAARRIEPAYTFPTDIVPAGNPILDDYVAVDASEGPTETIPEPKVGSVRVDGSGALTRSTAVPTIVQLLDGRGAVAHTALVQPDRPLPDFLSSPGEEAPTGPTKPDKEKGGARGPLLAAAVVGLVAAGGMYGGSFVTRAAYEDSATIDELNARRSTTNGLVIGAGVAGALAVGVGTTSLVVSGRF